MSWKLSKTRVEWENFKDNIRWPRGLSDIAHAYVNVFVEGFRWMPYTLGHVAALAPPAALLWLLLT